MGKINRILSQFMLGLIRFYRYCFSPLLGQRCRFMPSCSEYAMEAIQRHGSMKGVGLTVYRLCRCHPLSKGGYDPVPEKVEK